MPLILLIFGLGEMSKYVIVAIGVFFLMAINTMAGVMNVPNIYFDVARNLKASRWKIYFTVALPGALPGIFTGLRICVGTALLLLVAAEFVGASEGIGYRVWWAWSVFWVDTMYVGFAVIATLGFADDLLPSTISSGAPCRGRASEFELNTGNNRSRFHAELS